MGNKVTVITALTFLVTHVGFTPSATAKYALTVEQRCAGLYAAGNRIALQEQLEALLDQDPNHECIPLIVGLLGGAPQAAVSDGFPDDSERGDPDEADPY